MFLTEVNLYDICKKQYYFKLKSLYGVFSSLLLAQAIGILISFGGSGQSSSGIGNLSIQVNYYNANIVLILTLVWAFVSAVSIASKQIWNSDFSFVANRLSTNLANIMFLLTISVLGGITAMLSGSLLKILIYFIYGKESFVNDSFTIPPVEFMIGIITASLYVCLFAAIGYLVGSLIRINRVFTIIIPVAFFGGLFLEARTGGNGYLGSLLLFFLKESSFFLFTIKALSFLLILFGLATALSNRMEVRR